MTVKARTGRKRYVLFSIAPRGEHVHETYFFGRKQLNRELRDHYSVMRANTSITPDVLFIQEKPPHRVHHCSAFQIYRSLS